MTMRRLQLKWLVLLATIGLFERVAWAQQDGGQTTTTTFQVSESFTLFESDLAKVYGRWSGKPDFSQLDWCLQGANSGFVFLYCNGPQYSIVFDSESFLSGIDSLDMDTDYRVLEKMDEDNVQPSLIQDLRAVGDALTVISKKQSNSGQVLFIMYTDN